MHRIARVSLLGVLSGILLAGCDSNPSDTPFTTHGAAFDRKSVPDFPGSENFITGFTNPYLAYEVGKTFRYRGETEEGLEEIVVEVTGDTKVIMGVTTTVVRDRAYLDGQLIEDTLDWVAEDTDGNVWYFGEFSQEIKDGQVVSTEGSWEAGVDDALPGILMLAEPEKGARYAQEYAPDVAEDQARVRNLDESVSVEYGDFDGVLQTLEWNALEPGSREYKYYASGVGLVLETPTNGDQRIELYDIDD